MPDWAIFNGGVLAVGLACVRALAKRAAVGSRARARDFPATQLKKSHFVLKKHRQLGQCGLLGLLGKSLLCGSAERAGRTALGRWSPWLLALGALLVHSLGSWHHRTFGMINYNLSLIHI